MKAVMPDVPPHILQWRKRTGADRWDEMWEGVLHMPPMPSLDHQDFEGALETWLRTFWARSEDRKVYHQINLASVGGWPDNYRIPDVVLVTADRFDGICGDYFEGAPTVVVQIHSPGDEAYEKLSFYAGLGVPEVWIIDRDTKAPELYALHGGDYEPQPADQDGWLHSAATGVQMRGEAGNKIALQIAGDPSTLRLLPER
jgi:Uma2 family endonuclease